MKKRDEKGSIADPCKQYGRAVERALPAMKNYEAERANDVSVTAVQADATMLASRLKQKVQAVITSPPYRGAVGYYRRHELEMFWLDFTKSQEDRRARLDHYIGRLRVPTRDPLLKRAAEALSPTLEEEKCGPSTLDGRASSTASRVERRNSSSSSASTSIQKRANVVCDESADAEESVLLEREGGAAPKRRTPLGGPDYGMGVVVVEML